MKKSMYSTVTLLAITVTTVAITSISLAERKEDTPILESKCFLTMVANNRSVSLNETFEGSPMNSIHKAATKTFSKEGYQIEVIANDGWMGLTWKKGEKTIGSSLMGVANAAGPNRVLLLANPEDRTEQVSLSCSLQRRDQQIL